MGGQPRGLATGCRFRISLCHSELAHRGIDWQLGQPGLRHDDCHADGDLGHLPCAGLDSACFWRACDYDWRRGVHCGLEFRRHIAGFENRLPCRFHAMEAAGRLDDWRRGIYGGDWIHPEPDEYGFAAVSRCTAGMGYERAASGSFGSERREAATLAVSGAWAEQRIDTESQGRVRGAERAGLGGTG